MISLQEILLIFFDSRPLVILGLYSKTGVIS